MTFSTICVISRCKIVRKEWGHVLACLRVLQPVANGPHVSSERSECRTSSPDYRRKYASGRARHANCMTLDVSQRRVEIAAQWENTMQNTSTIREHMEVLGSCGNR